MATVKPLGVDKHAKKIIEGKFASNVQPKNAGKDMAPTHNWVCCSCNHENRCYWVTCQNCNERTRPW